MNEHDFYNKTIYKGHLLLKEILEPGNLLTLEEFTDKCQKEIDKIKIISVQINIPLKYDYSDIIYKVSTEFLREHNKQKLND